MVQEFLSARRHGNVQQYARCVLPMGRGIEMSSDDLNVVPQGKCRAEVGQSRSAATATRQPHHGDRRCNSRNPPGGTIAQSDVIDLKARGINLPTLVWNATLRHAPRECIRECASEGTKLDTFEWLHISGAGHSTLPSSHDPCLAPEHENNFLYRGSVYVCDGEREEASVVRWSVTRQRWPYIFSFESWFQP